MSRKIVRVGILHSQTGTMALSEKPLIDAALLAIAQINQTGGILGQYIEPIVVDAASDSAEFERLAKNLIQTQQVTTVFGCWTSAARKAVKPVFERLNALLWYPVQYEGLERSPNIFYTGSCPNQQVEPAVNWLLQNQGKRFYLLGSDYVFPRTVNKLICSQLKQPQAEVVGQKYADLGEANFTEIIAQIRQTRPDVVFNTLNGDSNQFFYQQYQAAGITAEEIPIFAVSVAESELQDLKEAAVGHYASWSYFQSLDSPENQRFVEDFQKKYGANRVTCDAIEAAYSQVYLWKQAVEAAESFEVERLRVAAYGQSFAAPGGLITIEPNHHVAKYCRIGQVLENGQFEIIYSSKTAIKPLPWLGVEKLNFDKSELVIEMLSQVSQGIQQTWKLEQKSRQLEIVAQELQQTQAAMQESAIALRSHNLVLTYLAKSPALQQGDLKAALREITEASAQNLQVERASVWLFDATGTKLECLDLFEKTQNQHSQGLELIATEYPAYFQALLQDQTIVANNVDNNPKTQELADYLRAFGITSLLDTAITIKGQMAGVISLEQVGTARDWTLEDQNFVRSLTDLVSLAIEAQERKLAEAALQQNEARWQLVLRGTGDGIFDWNVSTGETFASDRLLLMLGYTAKELAYSYETWRRLVHPKDLELAMSALQAHLEGKTELYRSEFRLRCQDGSYKWILARGQAQWDATGKPVRMLGSHQDISDVYDKLRLRQQVAEEGKLLLTIFQAISAAPDFDTALEVALQQVCQTTNWIYGEAWVPTTTESTLLHSPCCYYQPTETEAIKRFRDYSEVLTFCVGEEIPGTVLATRESQWFDNFSQLDDVLLRLELATECGLKTSFGVPIIASSNRNQETEQQESNLLSSQSSVLAVLVFFIRESRFNDQRLIQLVDVIATQLGGVLQQKKVQAEMKALFAAMTDVVTVRDASGRCLNVIPTNPKSLYKPTGAMIGRTLAQDLPPAQANLILKGILKAIMSQKTIVIEYCLPIDGKEVWLAETISPLSEETAILVAQDISEAVAAESQRKLAEAALRLEKEKSERLLRNILPAEIVQQLKQSQGVIAQQFDEVTILFADLVGFTPLSSRLNPIELVNLLDEIFSIFDELAERLGLEKIKTIGDAYMVAAGLPTPRSDHAQAIADMALAMQAAMECFQSEQTENIQIRLGINTGVVVAGVIGKKKFIYDLWGDAVNVASRMESSGSPGKIQVTTATYKRLKSQYLLEKRRTIEIKGKGEMVTYWLVGKKLK